MGQGSTDELKTEIEAQPSAFLATASADDQPYIQHRGGPAGLLHVLDEHTIAFADFAGNRQYITQRFEISDVQAALEAELSRLSSSVPASRE